jgi:hypothetical protein
MRAMRTNRVLGLIAVAVSLLTAGSLSTASTPPVLPDALWLKADDGTSYRPSDGVLLWYNMTTNDLTKRFYGPGPTNPNPSGGYCQIVSNALNGKAVVYMTNNYEICEYSWTQFPAISNIFGMGGTVLVVLNPSPAITTGARRVMNTCQQTTTGWEMYYSAAADKIGFSHHFSGGAGTWESAAVFGKGTNHLLTLTYDNGAIANDPKLYRNGRPVALAYDANPASGVAKTEQSGNMWLATRSYTGYSEMFTGNFAEIMIYRRVLSATERHGVEVYLGDKWGLDVPRWGTVLSIR